MRDLLLTTHTRVTLDEATHVLRRTRTTVPFDSLAAVEAEYDAVVCALDAVDRARYTQLIDPRSAPPRNDPEFEAAVERHHEALYRGFRANAVLVQSAVGKLHVQRMLGASGAHARVFTDEAEALAYLAEALLRPSRAPSRAP